jgi:hypothetical protein
MHHTGCVAAEPRSPMRYFEAGRGAKGAPALMATQTQSARIDMCRWVRVAGLQTHEPQAV